MRSESAPTRFGPTVSASARKTIAWRRSQSPRSPACSSRSMANSRNERVAFIARLAMVGRSDPDEALVGQRIKPVDHRDRQVAGRVDDILGHLRGPAAAEHGQSPEDRLLVRRQQVVAPVDGPAQRPLPLRQVPGTTGQQIQAALETIEDGRRSERAHPRGGQFDGQGQALQSFDDPLDGQQSPPPR